jgi:arginyl-tRNA synthetase
MDNLAKSVYARYRQLFEPDYPLPEDAYTGEYIALIAELIRAEQGDKLLASEDDLSLFKTAGENWCFKSIRHTLARLGITHDVFFSEQSLYKDEKIKEILGKFKEKNFSYGKDGAIWLKLSELKDEKGKQLFENDKVIVKSSGEPTYRLPDMAYHIDKIERGYDLIADIFGSDHSDTYKEVLAGVGALGYNTSKIKVIIHQMVTFVQEGKPVKMSKRSDNVYYLDDLLDDVGEDVAQFFFVMRSANTHLDFDIKLAKEQSDKNPVFYLQYAHARICGILRNAEGVLSGYGKVKDGDIDFSLMKETEEIDVMKTLTYFPEIVENSALTYEPHKIITYLNELAEHFHKFYHNHRVLNEEARDLSYARLKLCEAVKTVLKNGFSIIGINAPERM